MSQEGCLLAGIWEPGVREYSHHSHLIRVVYCTQPVCTDNIVCAGHQLSFCEPRMCCVVTAYMVGLNETPGLEGSGECQLYSIFHTCHHNSFLQLSVSCATLRKDSWKLVFGSSGLFLLQLFFFFLVLLCVPSV